MKLFSMVLALSMIFTTITVPAQQFTNTTQNIEQYNVQSAYIQNSNDNWYNLTKEQKLQDMNICIKHYSKTILT